jgi:hypothetical protein
MLDNLVKDVYQIVQTDGWMNEVLRQGLSDEISRRLQSSAEKGSRPPGLRLSQMGPRCPRALWYSVHRPDLAEPLPPTATIKYSYGHIIEALAITLAKAAGYRVEGEQDEISIDGIPGHRDCVIDGCVVDVKSTSSLGFLKFKNKTIAQDDPFGYLEQIDGYVVGSLDDPLVTVKDRGYLWAIDKQLGKMVLYEHKIREEHIRTIVTEYKQIVDLAQPPACRCGTVADGKSGNMRLDTRASYSPFKRQCFPGLRTFIYSDGPKFFSHIERVPDVPESFSRIH